jgi:hypothetical protein
MPSFIELLMAHRDEWERLLNQAMQPMIVKGINLGMAEIFKQAQSLGIRGAFDVTNPRVEAWAREYCAKRVTQIAETTQKRIQTVVADSLRDGKTIVEVRNALIEDPLIGEVSTRYRAEMIARTETANAYVNGNRLGCLESNAYAQEAGMAAPFSHLVLDANPGCCDRCSELDGVLMWSFDETVELVHPNCRCSTRVIISSSYL